MQKIFYWFRSEKPAPAEDGRERWSRGKKWRSSLLHRQHHGNGTSTTGGEGLAITAHFDAIASASTSSPAILPEQKALNGHTKSSSRSGRSERRRQSRTESKGEKVKSASSVRHPVEKSGSSRKRGVAAIPPSSAATTEDIPDSSSGPKFDVHKKAVSANEAIGGGKRPGILARLRQRLSAKSNDKGKARKSELLLEVPPPLPRLAREELRMERLALARMMAVKEEVQLGEERRPRRYERLAESTGNGAIKATAEWANKREMLQQQRSEELDAFSQGRTSSFDYFSATASPTTDQPNTARPDSEFDSARNSRMGMANEQPMVGPHEEEERRFATAAEARAYLRRQIAAETGQDGGHEGGEETAFDADDEISNRLNAFATGDSICQLQRPHSAMSTSSTLMGRNQQRESIYFTVVQPGTVPGNVQATPSSPPQRQTQQQIEAATAQLLEQRQQQFEQTKQRSMSQQVLAGLQHQQQHSSQDSPVIGQGSEPGSTKVGRRKLRFVIPQVSICSVEDDSGTHGTADDLLNNNDSQQPNRPDIGAFDADSLNNNPTAGSSGSSIAATILPGMLGVAPEAEEELKRALSQMDKRNLTLAQRRQSNMDVVHQASGRRTSTTLIPLTSAQIHLIRSLWRQVYLSKGPTVIGSQISHRLFFKEPQTREQFRRCPLPQQYVNHDSFSKAHCKQISEMIDQVVESLDDLENVSGMLERVGRAHARISGGQLSSKLWNSVAETFIDCTLEWGDRRARSETVRKAWALIIAFMIERIKHGHLEERRQITAIRSTIASLERFAVGGGTTAAGGGSGNGSVACSQQQSPSQSQLPVPLCPIRRVSATATLVNGLNRPTKFSPDQFRGPNPGSTAYMGGSSAAAASIVSPVANRRKPLRLSNPSPKATTRSGRTRSDAERPPALGAHNRKGSADSDVVHTSGRGSGSAGTGTPLQRQSTETGRHYTDV